MKMNEILFCLLAVLNVCSVWAQPKTLKFGKNGDFKIVQFTDVHYKYDDQANSQIALDRMNEVLDAEHPDCVVLLEMRLCPMNLLRMGYSIGCMYSS